LRPEALTVMFTFKKEERLCRKSYLDALFTSGSSFFVYPFSFRYLEITDGSLPAQAQIVISVPKRKFKRAHDRNRIRRQLREVYRLNKAKFYDQLAAGNKQVVFLVSYSAKTELPYATLHKQLVYALHRFAEVLNPPAS
jgi:ribonuclease P protein component